VQSAESFICEKKTKKEISSPFRAIFTAMDLKFMVVTQSSNTIFRFVYISILSFSFASLDLGHLATSFCLLRLPKMPELGDCQGKLTHFVSARPEVDINAIP